MTRKMAEKAIREIAADDEKVIFSTHALERMTQRGINPKDVADILLKGNVTTDPVKGKRGGWECNVTKNVRANRDATAVTAIYDAKNYIIIITVMWEDLK